MRKLQKLASLLLALVMIFALSTTAFAVSNYTITVTNAEAGATYSAYKIFDATSSGNAVSYTIPEGSDIASAANFDTIFDTTENGSLVYVTVKEDITDTQVTNWLKGYVAGLQSDAAVDTVENSANADSVTLDVGAQGYYYVTTATGAAVSITSVTGSATVIDKNDRVPSVDPDDGKQVATSQDGTYSSVTTMNVGDTAYFKITFTAVNYVVADGESTQITAYTVTDTPSGFRIDPDSVVVKVDNITLTSGYTVAVDQTTGVLTVAIDWDDEDGNTVYASSAAVVVTYEATLTNRNLADASTNKAQITYNDTTLEDTPEVEVYNYTVAIDKYDANDQTTKLSGAKFVLYKTDGEGDADQRLYYVVDVDTGAVTWTATQSEATEVTTDSSGAAKFEGLAAGTYYLLETKAPDGYNLLDEATEVTLADITSTESVPTSLTNTTSVANNSGSTLPSTGGMGTTILYTIGIILVLGAGVLLVTKRRMSAEG